MIMYCIGDSINHLIPCHLLLPTIFLSIRVFSNESAVQIRWPRHWSFSISHSDEYLGLISFKIDWFVFLPVQGTLKSHLQHQSSKALIPQHSPFFIVQLSQLYLTTGKAIALTIWTFVGKGMFLLFNTLSRFVIAFLPRSSSVSLVAQSSPTLCEQMDCSMTGFPVHHQLLTLAQTHVYWVDDAIQPSYSLLSPSSPAFYLVQHQGLFQWISSLHQVAKVLGFQLQHPSFQWIFSCPSCFPLGWTDFL